MTEEQEKEYAEFRIFLLGPEKAGKRSFIKKMLSMPTNSQILGIQAENDLMQNYLSSTLKTQGRGGRSPKKQGNNNLKNSYNGYKTMTYSVDKKNAGKTVAKNQKTANISENKDTKITNTKSSYLSYQSSHKPKREKYQEFPAKMYTINKNKILYKMYYIPPAERLSYDYEPKEEDDSEYEIEKEHKMSLKGIKTDIRTILTTKGSVYDEEKLSKYSMKIINVFLFMFDLSDFYSFKEIIIYYSALSKYFKFSENDSIKSVLIGNKKDKENVRTKQQNIIFENFISKTGMASFEVSNKPYYNFVGFFDDFFYKILYKSLDNVELTKPELDETLNRLLKIKPNFSKSQRSNIVTDFDNPGPIYNTNVYTVNSPKELYNALTNKKTRFVDKIFLNKSGPKIVRPKSSKEALVKQQMEKEKENEQFLFNKLNTFSNSNNNVNFSYNTAGFSFGLVNGKLGLKSERKKLIKEQERKFFEGLGDNNISDFVKQLNREVKDTKYFNDVANRKNELYQNKIKEKRNKNNEIMRHHKHNLDELNKRREKMKEKGK